MADVTLQHCHPAPMDPLPVGTITFTAGAPGDGSVTVTINGTPTPVNCGAPVPLTIPPGATVMMHFEKAPDGPDSVVASWS